MKFSYQVAERLPDNAELTRDQREPVSNVLVILFRLFERGDAKMQPYYGTPANMMLRG
jgi:hypothetical protein